MGTYEERLKKGSYTGSLLQKGNTFRKELAEPETSEEIPDDLEEIENQIHKLKDRLWEMAWLIGKRLILVKDKYLDATEFLNIGDYSKEKFGIEKRTTYRFIFIADNYDKMTARTLGSKLRLLEPLDDEKRKEYLKWMKLKEPTYREIEERIKSEMKKEINQPEKFSLSKSILKVNFKEVGGMIPKEKTQDFLKDLDLLINKYVTK